MALSAKYAEGNLYIVDGINLDQFFPSLLEKRLARWPFDGPVMVIFSWREFDPNFALAARSFPFLHLMPSIGANTYDILCKRAVVITQNALKELEYRLNRPIRPIVKYVAPTMQTYPRVRTVNTQWLDKLKNMPNNVTLARRQKEVAELTENREHEVEGTAKVQLLQQTQ